MVRLHLLSFASVALFSPLIRVFYKGLIARLPVTLLHYTWLSVHLRKPRASESHFNNKQTH